MPQNLFRSAVLAAAWIALVAGPALAQEARGTERPWHYWIAPFLLVVTVVAVAGLGVRYWFRVMSGRTRR